MQLKWVYDKESQEYLGYIENNLRFNIYTSYIGSRSMYSINILDKKQWYFYGQVSTVNHAKNACENFKDIDFSVLKKV